MKKNPKYYQSEEAEPQVKERPHPLLKVPGTGKRAVWNKWLGRWVIPPNGDAAKMAEEQLWRT